MRVGEVPETVAGQRGGRAATLPVHRRNSRPLVGRFSCRWRGVGLPCPTRGGRHGRHQVRQLWNDRQRRGRGLSGLRSRSANGRRSGGRFGRSRELRRLWHVSRRGDRAVSELRSGSADWRRRGEAGRLAADRLLPLTLGAEGHEKRSGGLYARLRL